MMDPNSPDPSRKRSFFDDDTVDDSRETSTRNGPSRGQEPRNQRSYSEERRDQSMRSNASFSNGRERMASRYHEEEEEEEYEDDYDRRGHSRFSFMQGLFHSDSSTHRLAFAAAGIGGILLLFIGGWMMTHAGHQGTPIIEQAKIAAKEKPAPSDNAETIGMDKGEGATDANGKPTLAPGPEQANPAALAAQYGGNKNNTSNVQPPPVMANNNSQQETTNIPQTTGVNPSKPMDSNQGEVVQRNSPSPSVSSSKEETNNEEVTPPPAKPHSQSHHKSVHKKAEAAKTVENNKAVSNGHYVVQLAALGSSSAAQKQWQVMRKKAPELLGKHSPSIQKAEVKGNAIYRLRIKGFGSKAQASRFCAQLKAKNLSCTLANF